MIRFISRSQRTPRDYWREGARKIPSVDEVLDVTGSSVSHYRVLEKLGSGGMGEVYAAMDTLLARRVAIKFPSLKWADNEGRSRFLIEARAASRLDHPNIGRIYDYGEAPDGRPFLVMELVKGTTLRQVLKGGPLPPARSVAIIEGVLRALREAHRNGLIHRDIKPANVMLTETGEVKVLDFGLAKEILQTPTGNLSQAATAPMGPTRAGTVPGTPEYMSPEQARGVLLDQRSDLFSAGLVLYECLTGRQAFSGGSGHEILNRVANADLPPPSSWGAAIPVTLDRITMKALAREVAQRYQTSDEMLDDLAPPASTVTLPVTSSMRSPVARMLESRRKTAVMCGMVLAAAIAAGWLLWPGRPHQPPAEAFRWYQLGAAALRDGTYHQAAKELEQAVSVDPDFVLAHAQLAEALNELDDSDGASREMLAALATRSGNTPSGVPALYVDAIHHTLLRDFSGAARIYTELERRVPATDKAAVMVDLARVREKSERVPQALEAYRRAIELDPQNAAAHLHTAILLGRQQEPQAAAEFGKAESLYQSMSNPEGQAEVYYQRGLLESTYLRKLPEARADLEKAIQLARAISTPFQEIASTLQLSVVTYQGGEAPQAERMASGAVEKARRAGMWNLVARGLTDLGSAQSLKGDLVTSEANFKDALDLSHRFHMRRNEARALFSLASLHQRKGDPDRALQEIGPAVEYYRQANFRREAMLCLVVIARANRDRGNEAEALAAFQEELSLAHALDDPQQVTFAEQGIASVLFQQEHLPEALVHYQAAYESARQVKYRPAMGRGLAGRAAALWRLGRYAEAEAALKDADVIAGADGSSNSLGAVISERRAGSALSRGLNREAAAQAGRSIEMERDDPPARASTMCLSGLALARSGSPVKGKPLCEAGLASLVQTKETYSITEARLAMGEILMINGEPMAAQEQIRQALEPIEAAGRKESAWRAWALAARACRSAGDPVRAKAAAGRASVLLADLRAAWKTDFDRYIQRPDLRILQQELKK